MCYGRRLQGDLVLTRLPPRVTPPLSAFSSYVVDPHDRIGREAQSVQSTSAQAKGEAERGLCGSIVKLQIWDTAGQERFRTITTAYYRGAMGILLVYDGTDERSFNSQSCSSVLAERHLQIASIADIRTWHANVEQHATADVNKILIGNKCDWSEKKVFFQ